jgi:tetratricopeptide (TPR) repeat protein
MKPVTETRTASRAEQTIKKWVVWCRTHQEQFWAIAGSAVAAALLIFFMVHRRQTQNEQAWIQLGSAQAMLLQGQMDKAAEALNQWETRFKGSSATSYEQFLRADLYYRTKDYAKSAEMYGTIAQIGNPTEVRPLALSAQSSALEMAGSLPEAQAATQQFLDRYPDHYLTASMYLSQARLAEMTNNAAVAAAIYDRFLTLYPQTPWTAFVRSRVEKLSGSAPAAAPLSIKK